MRLARSRRAWSVLELRTRMLVRVTVEVCFVVFFFIFWIENLFLYYLSLSLTQTHTHTYQHSFSVTFLWMILRLNKILMNLTRGLIYLSLFFLLLLIRTTCHLAQWDVHPGRGHVLGYRVCHQRIPRSKLLIFSTSYRYSTTYMRLFYLRF